MPQIQEHTDDTEVEERQITYILDTAEDRRGIFSLGQCSSVQRKRRLWSLKYFLFFL